MSEWPTLDAFNSVMRERLYDNKAEKGGDGAWRDSTYNSASGLKQRLTKNIEQLEGLFSQQWKVPVGFASTLLLVKDINNAITKKCADIANMAMMIADYEQRLAPTTTETDDSSDDIPF